jgi:phosphonate transport system permease protein
VIAQREFIVGHRWKGRDALGGACAAMLVALMLIWTAHNLGLSVTGLVKGAPWIGDFVARMFPPNWAFLQRLAKPVAETLQIALWGTLLGCVLALPLCFFGARNFSHNRLVFHAARQVFNAARGINEIIFALIFVAAVGLGPFAGVLALSVHGAGMLGKFFAEAIEEIDGGPVEALRATGASGAQTVAFAVLPQVLPSWIAATLYRFEVNLRASTILGMVGAGGIGYELYGSMRLFQYQDTATCILVILLLVMSADYLSSRLRALVLQG